MHRRLLFVYWKRQSMSSSTLFHSETLAAGQICQSKGQDHINIISVESGYNSSCLPLSWHSHLEHKQTGLGLEYSCYGTSASPPSHGPLHVLSCSLCISLVCCLLLDELKKILVLCAFAGIVTWD